MEGSLQLIWIFAFSLGLACFLGYTAFRFKLSPIIAYLLTGYVLGPNSPGFTADQAMSDQLASIGVTLLMFVVGLNFNWKDLVDVRRLVVPGALFLSIMSIITASAFIAYMGGLPIEGFVVGIAICVSSTVVVVRILTDQGLLHTKQGHIVLGWTIVEDLISVFGLILLPAIASASADGAASDYLFSLVQSIAIVLLKIAFLVAVIYLFLEKIIEKILQIIARTRSHELFTLAILSSVFLLALGSAHLFGISLALGAFIAGTVVGKTDLSHQAAANALPMRDAFAVIFFISVGMLFNPFVLLDNLFLFLGLLAIILLVRPFIAFLILKVARYPSYIGFTVAAAICQIGEYSFIIAEEGFRLQVLPDNAYDIIIACAFMSIIVSSVGFKLFRPLIKPSRPSSSHEKEELISMWDLSASSEQDSFLPRAVVIGYGPVGKAAAKALTDRYQVLVIERNVDTVSTQKKETESITMLFGDASQTLLLMRASVDKAQLIVITLPDAETTLSVIKAIDSINPGVDIIARVHFQGDYDKVSENEQIPVVCDEIAAAEQMSALIKSRFNP